MIVAEGEHLRLISHDNWEFVERKNANGVVFIVPITNNKEIVLIEEYRVPIANDIIELPAGLAGDTTENESFEDAANRELLEETGYRAERLVKAHHGPSSAGLTSEQLTLFIAFGATKITDDVEEHIKVHVVPLDNVDNWLQSQEQTGKAISMRIYAGLYILYVMQRREFENVKSDFRKFLHELCVDDLTERLR